MRLRWRGQKMRGLFPIALLRVRMAVQRRSGSFWSPIGGHRLAGSGRHTRGQLLDGLEDGGNFAIEGRKFEVDDRAAGVEDDVDGGGEGREILADGFAHA